MPGRVSPGFKEPGIFKPDRVGPDFGTSPGAAPSRGTVTTYYVDPVNGLDANNGLGPDASDATNKPWKTLSKALGATGLTNGGTLYLAPGVYREIISLQAVRFSVPTIIAGDPANAQGFKTSAGVRVQPGAVRWTGAVTSDVVNQADSATLSINGNAYLSFRSIYFVGGRTGNALAVSGNIDSTSRANHHISFRDCTFWTQGATNLDIGSSSGSGSKQSFDWSFDGCIFVSLAGSNAVSIHPIAAAVGFEAVDMNIAFRNCKFFGQHGGAGVSCDQSGGTGVLGGGILVDSCSFIGMGTGVRTTSTAYPTGRPAVRVINSLIIAWSNGIAAQTSGQIFEDYNIIVSGTPRQNIAVGPHSQAGSGSTGTYSSLFHMGQEMKWGANLRSAGEPTADSVHLGFNVLGRLGEDFWGNPRTPLPSSLGALGAEERRNSWLQETVTVRTGSNALSITGPGFQDFDIPVDASATTVAVYLRRDSSYVGYMPELRIINGEEAGVPNMVAPLASGVADTWEQVSATFTPVRAGVVTLRLLSQDRSGAGKAFADDFSVT